MAATRKAESDAWFASAPNMDDLLFDSWPDRRLARMLLRLYGAHPDMQLAQVFLLTLLRRLFRGRGLSDAVQTTGKPSATLS